MKYDVESAVLADGVTVRRGDIVYSLDSNSQVISGPVVDIHDYGLGPLARVDATNRAGKFIGVPSIFARDCYSAVEGATRQGYLRSSPSPSS